MILVAAAVLVGWIAIPAARGPVRQFVLQGTMAPGCADALPSIRVECLQGGDIAITRWPVAMRGQPVLNVEISGHDLRILESVTPLDPSHPQPTQYAHATFMLNMVGQDYWHVRYCNLATGHLAVFALHNRPGITTTKRLTT